MSDPWYAAPLACALALAACVSTTERVIEPAPPTFAAPLVDPIPLRVAYSLDASVDEEVVYREGPSDRPWVIYHLRLGPASRAGLDRVLAALFPQGAPEGAAATGLDGRIRVRLVKAYATREGATIVYELDFMGADGTAVGAWQVVGAAKGDDAEGSVPLAVRAAAAQIARELPRQPAIQAWLGAAAGGDGGKG